MSPTACSHRGMMLRIASTGSARLPLFSSRLHRCVTNSRWDETLLSIAHCFVPVAPNTCRHTVASGPDIPTCSRMTFLSFCAQSSLLQQHGFRLFNSITDYGFAYRLSRRQRVSNVDVQVVVFKDRSSRYDMWCHGRWPHFVLCMSPGEMLSNCSLALVLSSHGACVIHQ